MRVKRFETVEKEALEAGQSNANDGPKAPTALQRLEASVGCAWRGNDKMRCEHPTITRRVLSPEGRN